MSIWSNLFGLVISFLGVVLSSQLSDVVNLIRADGSLGVDIFLLALSSAIGNCENFAQLTLLMKEGLSSLYVLSPL